MLTDKFGLTLRDIEQLFARVNLVLRATPENVFVYPALLAFLIVLRDRKPELYREFITETGRLTPILELLRSLMGPPQRQANFHAAVLEGLLIAAKPNDDGATAAIELHKAALNDQRATNESHDYSQTVIEAARRPGGLGQTLALRDLVQRIEMLRQFSFPQP